MIVQGGEDLRALDVAAQPDRPWRLQGDGAEQPGEAQPERAQQERPARAVDDPERRPEQASQLQADRLGPHR